jgi:sulfur carrier protein ThiS
VNVYLHATLGRESERGVIRNVEVELPEGSLVADLIERLDLPLELEHLLVAVNHRVVDESTALQDGDRVNVMPALSGG